jgi:hypothetical protein
MDLNQLPQFLTKNLYIALSFLQEPFCFAFILFVLILLVIRYVLRNNIDHIKQKRKVLIFIVAFPLPIICYLLIKLYRYYFWNSHKTNYVLLDHIIRNIDSYFGVYLGVLSVVLGSFIYLAIKHSANKNINEFLQTVTDILKKSEKGDVVYLLMPSVMPGLFEYIQNKNPKFNSYKKQVFKKIREGVDIKFAVLQTELTTGSPLNNWEKIINLSKDSSTSDKYIELESILKSNVDPYIKEQEVIFKKKSLADGEKKLKYYEKHAGLIIKATVMGAKIIKLNSDFGKTKIIAVVNSNKNKPRHFIGNYFVNDSFEFNGMSISDENASGTIVHFVEAIIDKYKVP